MSPALHDAAAAAFALAGRLLPPEPSLCCWFGTPGSDNAHAFFEHLLRREDRNGFRHVWVVHDPPSAIATLSRNWSKELQAGVVRVVSRRSLTAIVACRRARFVFFTHLTYGFCRGRPGQTFVNLWHGMPLKRIAFLNPKRVDPVPYTDVTIATSPLFRSVMARCFAVPEERVLLVGQPRNDRLFGPALDTLPFGTKRGDYAGLAVWMPTFRTWMHPKDGLWVDSRSDPMEEALADPALDELEDRLAPHGSLCVIKLHPLDRMNEREFRRRPHVLVVRERDARREGLDTYGLLAGADRLVTDFSSVFIDFALTGRPMGFFVPDRLEYEEGRGLIPEVREALGMPGLRLDDRAAVADFLAGSLPALPFPAANARAMHDGYPQPSCAGLARALGL